MSDRRTPGFAFGAFHLLASSSSTNTSAPSSERSSDAEASPNESAFPGGESGLSASKPHGAQQQQQQYQHARKTSLLGPGGHAALEQGLKAKAQGGAGGLAAALGSRDGASGSGSGTGSAVRYSVGALLALSKSSLVERPANLPALKLWFGRDSDAAPFRKTTNQGGRGGYEGGAEDGLSQSATGGYARRGGEDGPGGPRDRYGNNRRYAHDGGEGGGAYAEDGGMSRSYESKQRGERSGANPGGRNPFGQLSSSGAFKPAGGPESPIGERKFQMGSERIMGSGRERRGQALGERGERGERGQQGRGFREGEEGAEGGESYGGGIEIERRSNVRSGLADSYNDWRKPGQQAGPRDGARGARELRGEGAGGPRGERGERERRQPGGGKPSWAEEDGGAGGRKPAWMDKEDSRQSQQPRGKQSQQNDSDAGGFFADLPPVSGTHVDSIQAFKAQMREKERLEKEAREGGPAPKVTAGPPPGLSLGAGLSADASAASGPLSANDAAPRPKAGPPPGLGGGAGPAESGSQDLKSPLERSSGGMPQPPASAPAAAPGGRSSRFARFFDKPREGAPGAGQSQSSAGPSAATSPAPSSNAAMDLSSIFGAASASASTAATSPHLPRLEQGRQAMPPLSPAAFQQQQHQQPPQHFAQQQQLHQQQHHQGLPPHHQGPPPSSPPRQQSQATPEQASMQKLMAMLSMGAMPSPGGSVHMPPPPPHQMNRSSDSQNHDAASPGFQRGPPLSPFKQMGPDGGPPPPPPQHDGGIPFGLDPRMFGRRPASSSDESGRERSNGRGGESDSAGGGNQNNNGSSNSGRLPPGMIPGGGGGPPPGPPMHHHPQQFAHGPHHGGPPAHLAGLPPHIQQQLAGLPPHVQHQILSAQRPPPPSQQQQQQGSNQGSGGNGGGGGGSNAYPPNSPTRDRTTSNNGGMPPFSPGPGGPMPPGAHFGGPPPPPPFGMPPPPHMQGPGPGPGQGQGQPGAGLPPGMTGADLMALLRGGGGPR